MTARYSEFADAERRWAFDRADITNGIRLSKPRHQEVVEPDGGAGPCGDEQRDHGDAAALPR